ncbi:hypothetical protein OCB01_17260 [Bacillus cereus]|nr:hypothetical protein [Bacillus cereus]
MEVEIQYPEFYKKFADNERLFKKYLAGYIECNEPYFLPIRVTEDLRLMCKPNPSMSPKKALDNHSYKKKGGKKKR